MKVGRQRARWCGLPGGGRFPFWLECRRQSTRRGGCARLWCNPAARQADSGPVG